MTTTSAAHIGSPTPQAAAAASRVLPPSASQVPVKPGAHRAERPAGVLTLLRRRAARLIVAS